MRLTQRKARQVVAGMARWAKEKVAKQLTPPIPTAQVQRRTGARYRAAGSHYSQSRQGNMTCNPLMGEEGGGKSGPVLARTKKRRQTYATLRTQ